MTAVAPGRSDVAGTRPNDLARVGWDTGRVPLRSERFREIIRAPLEASWSGRLVAIYVLIMPFIAGVPRGELIPLVRLNEVLQFGLLGLGVLIAITGYAAGRRWRFEIAPVDWWMFAVAFCGSFLPLASLLARGESFDFDSVVESMALFKYFLLYLLARTALRSTTDVAAVMMAVLVATTGVAGLALLEGFGVGPTGGITRSIVSDGQAGAGEGRAYTMLGSAISTGAVLAMSAAVVYGLVITRRHVAPLGVLGVVMLGVLATGQMTSLLAIVVVLGVAALHYRVAIKSIIIGVPVLLGAGLVAMPIIEQRLADSAGRSVIPQSWLIRWANVTELYWPSISDGGWIIGVDPDTVLVPPDTWRAEVFLESGYLWMLWVGGLPLLLCFCGFLIAAWRSCNVETTDPTIEVARVTARCAIVFMVVFNIIDPHLSLRGGADLLYVLVPAALAFAPLTVSSERQVRLLSLIDASERHGVSTTARIQIGEIGGDLLRPNGWAPVSPGHGIDRGIDILVRDRGATIGEARIYFEAAQAKLDGLMLHSVRSTDAAADALVWRGIALCAQSMGLRSMILPPGTHGLIELDRRELQTLGRHSEQLESKRHLAQLELREMQSVLGSRTTVDTPPGIRLQPGDRISRSRRVIDIVLAGTGLLVFAPIAVLVAWRIRRSSPGPVLFRQMRIGSGGRPFRILKFRTMDNSAGDDVHRASIETSIRRGEHDLKVEDDPRVTRIGAFLRRTSLDEIPQLINVVRGEMTLVGPRPSLLWETSMFSSRTRRRLTLTPGIAGLWQSSGRGDLSIEDMLELDLDYAESVSLVGDARILIRTVIAVLKREGAR